jgi:hypothetical protein
MSERDERQLAAVTAELEKGLTPSGERREAGETPAAVETGVRELSGGAQAVETKTAEKATQVKTFGADRTDFYPTEIHKPGAQENESQ